MSGNVEAVKRKLDAEKSTMRRQLLLRELWTLAQAQPDKRTRPDIEAARKVCKTNAN